MPDIRKNSIKYAAAPSPADISEMINEAINTFKQTLFAIGDVFLTYSATELPANKFGGNWELTSKGRVLLGVDPAQSQFNQGMKIGGSFNIPVTITNMPEHIHTIPQTTVPTESSGAHTHTISTTSVASASTTPGATGQASANHTHATVTDSDLRCISHGTTASPGLLWGQNVPNAVGYASRIVSDYKTGTQSANHTHTSAAHAHEIPALSGTAASNGAHTHTITIPAIQTQSNGSGVPLDTTPSYETLYVWKRIA